MEHILNDATVPLWAKWNALFSETLHFLPGAVSTDVTCTLDVLYRSGTNMNVAYEELVRLSEVDHWAARLTGRITHAVPGEVSQHLVPPIRCAALDRDIMRWRRELNIIAMETGPRVTSRAVASFFCLARDRSPLIMEAAIIIIFGVANWDWSRVASSSLNLVLTGVGKEVMPLTCWLAGDNDGAAHAMVNVPELAALYREKGFWL